VSIAAQPLTSDELEAACAKSGPNVTSFTSFPSPLHTANALMKKSKPGRSIAIIISDDPHQGRDDPSQNTRPEDRRQWRKRIEDHDGLREGDGGIERC